MKAKYLKWKQVALLAATLGVAGGACAQYVWLDEHGVKQFSDVAPPANVPQSRILKQPQQTRQVTAAPDDAATSGAPADNAKAPMTTAELNAEYNKHKKEQADKAKKADDQAKLQAAKASNCERATNYLAGLKSGVRISTTDANGERGYMSDEDRAREQQQAQSVIDSSCQ